MSNEEFRKPFWQTLKKNRVVFDDAYEEEINGLLALSQTEIDTITPDDIDVKTYDELIMIASNASRSNVFHAEVKKKQIVSLGEVATDIAQKKSAPIVFVA